MSEAGSALPIDGAAIKVKNVTSGRNQDIDHDVSTISSGEYWRLLTPGQYEITATKTGYEPLTKLITVANLPHHEAFRVDFALRPSNAFDERAFYQFGNGNGANAQPNRVEFNNPDVLRLVNYLRDDEQNIPLADVPEVQMP